MREFKFIRGKYTDENIFNTDETKACLFAYDSEGNLVQFIEKNDKDFQEKFVGLSSDNRLSEIYTFRPSQFKISAQKESAGHYSFNFEADEDVYDGSRQFPADVITNAQTHIKSHTEAAFNTTSGLPILNLDGEVEQQTPMIFTFNNKKSFTRNLVFKVSGFLKERGYVTAQGEGITAYPKSGDKIDFGEKTEGTEGTNATQGTFYQGVKQKEAETKIGTIYANTKKISTTGSLSLAKNYVPGAGYKFIKGNQFETDIPYQDRLSFTLYSEVSGYLTAAEANDAATSTKTFNNASAHKYKINSAGEYEYDSGANANYNVQYYLIQAGSSASATKLRKSSSSPEKYSVISGNDYYFVDNTTPSKGFSSLGFKDIGNYITAANTSSTAVNLTETKRVGANKVAFIKYDGIWHYANSNVAIIPKFYKTVGGKKVYLSSIKKDSDTYILTGDNNYTDTVAEDLILNAVDGTDYYYGEILLTDYCQFTANAAASQAKFINFNSLDNIVSNTGITEGVDYGNIYTPVVAEITTSYTIKKGYVAYTTTETLTELIDKDKNKAYERNEAKEVTSIGSLEYNFYYVNSGEAYMLKGECNVGARANNEFVEGYAASYENYFIFKNKKLSNISTADLSGKTTITYYENNNHHIIGNGVYDDNDDGKKYVMFSDNNWVEDIAINSENTLVNEDNVPAPNTTENVLRFITEVNVNATESD